MIKFTSLLDFPQTRLEGTPQYTVHFTRLLDRVISISEHENGEFMTCINNPLYHPGSDENGHDWDSTNTNWFCAESLDEAIKAANDFANTELLSWDQDLFTGTALCIQKSFQS